MARRVGRPFTLSIGLRESHAACRHAAWINSKGGEEGGAGRARRAACRRRRARKAARPDWLTESLTGRLTPAESLAVRRALRHAGLRRQLPAALCVQPERLPAARTTIRSSLLLAAGAGLRRLRAAAGLARAGAERGRCAKAGGDGRRAEGWASGHVGAERVERTPRQRA